MGRTLEIRTLIQTAPIDKISNNKTIIQFNKPPPHFKEYKYRTVRTHCSISEEASKTTIFKVLQSNHISTYRKNKSNRPTISMAKIKDSNNTTAWIKISTLKDTTNQIPIHKTGQ